jgi:amidase
VLEKTIQALEKAGAKMKQGWPNGFKIEELYENYMYLLHALMLSYAPAAEQEAARKGAAAKGETPPAFRSYAEWQNEDYKQFYIRQQWQEYFEEVDVFLSPVAFTTAFPHDHSQPDEKRVIATATGPRNYHDLIRWIAPPTLTGCPATVAPVGRGEHGLPIGIQIMGPFWEDATPITLAKLLVREIGGFEAPPAYGS